MSAPWTCDLCGKGDGEYEGLGSCDCVNVRASDWAAIRELWKSVRRLSFDAADGRAITLESPGALVADRADSDLLDRLIFAGETTTDRVDPPITGDTGSTSA